MKRITAIISIVLAIAAIVVAFQKITQAQHSEMPAGGLMVMQAVENTWAGIAFEVKVDKETLEKVRPQFQKAWDERKNLIKESEEDIHAVIEGMMEIKAELDEKLKSVLTEKQMQKLAEWERSQQQMHMGGPMGR